MEIIDDNKLEQEPQIKNNYTPVGGCLIVFAKALIGLIFLCSAFSCLGCTIAAAVLPIVGTGVGMSISGVGMNISGVDVIEGTFYIAEMVCIIMAIASALMAYLTFCLAFSKRVRGWVVALFAVVLIGGTIGGTIYGTKIGFDIYSIADEIEELDRRLDEIGDNEEEIIQAVLALPGSKSLRIEIDDYEELVILDALDIEESIKQRVKDEVLLADEDVRIKVKQESNTNGEGTREITIRLRNEDINIIQTLPIQPQPAIPAE